MLSCLKRRLDMGSELPQMSSNGKAQLVLVKQPRRYFRFRYRSELGSTSHGVLQADSCSCGVEYPTVQLTVPAVTTEVSTLYMLCMLYEKSQAGKYQLSPHQLIYKRDKDKEKSKAKGKEKCMQKSNSRRSKQTQLSSSSSPAMLSSTSAWSSTSPWSSSTSSSLDDKRIMENHEFGVVALIAQDMSSSESNERRVNSYRGSSNDNASSSEDSTSHSLSYTFELRDCFIQKTLSSSTQSVVEAKSKALRDICADLQFEVKHKRGPDGCIVYLGFTVCTRSADTGLYQPYSETVYSEAIRNGQNVCVERIINGTVSTNGGEEIVLVVSGIRKADVQLRLYTFDRDRTTIWEQCLQKELTIERKNMITFKAPRYDGDIADGIDNIRCFIEVIRPSDNVRSVPVHFLYKIGAGAGASGSTRGNESIRQAGALVGQDINDATTTTVISEPMFVPFNDIERKCLAIVMLQQSTANKYRQIVALNDEYKNAHERNNSVFHELVATGNVSCLYQLWNIPQLHNLMRYTINSDSENLLHYACKSDRFEFIHPLLALGDMLCGQDSRLRTPLHVAIEALPHECVQQFVTLLKCHMDYPEERNQLRELFFLHNADGYTVLHLAVLKGLPELLGEMIDFCITNQIDLSSIRTMGAGNTILHLAVLEKLSDMVRLIINKMPSARFFVNNDDETVFDMRPVSKYENVIKILKRYDDLYI